MPESIYPIPPRLFWEALAQEVEVFQLEATSYRQQTAWLALDVAHTLPSLTLLSDNLKTKHWVKGLEWGLDEERVQDVTDFLVHLWGALVLHHTLSAELQAELDARRQRRQVVLSPEKKTR